MSFLWAVVAGLVIGLLARLLLPGRRPVPLWLTVVLGVIGAVAGNALAGAIGVRHTDGVDWVRHLLQIGVAAVLITLLSPMGGRRDV